MEEDLEKNGEKNYFDEHESILVMQELQVRRCKQM